jgi:predicted DNA-binding protein
MTGGGPLSVPLPKELRRRLEAYAVSHQLKLATAARALIDQRLGEVEDSVLLTEAEEWQRAQAWATWEKLKEGKTRTLSRAEVMSVFGRKRRR